MTTTNQRSEQTASMWSRPRQLRLFSSTRHGPRTRRATDIVLLGTAVLGTTLSVAAAERPKVFEEFGDHHPLWGGYV